MSTNPDEMVPVCDLELNSQLNNERAFYKHEDEINLPWCQQDVDLVMVVLRMKIGFVDFEDGPLSHCRRHCSVCVQ